VLNRILELKSPRGPECRKLYKGDASFA